MKLPSMVNGESTASVAVTTFGGLNLTPGAGANELTRSENLSHGGYPALTPRAPRETYGAYPDGDGFFLWDGKQVVTAGGVLYYDGEPLTNISRGEHQFAVVNTNLVIWPDKKCIDLVRGKVVDMAAEVTTKSAPETAGTDKLDKWNLKTVQTEAHVSAATGKYQNGIYYYLVYTYGKDVSAISCSSGVWTLPAPTLKRLAPWDYPTSDIPVVEEGDIVIPVLTVSYWSSEKTWSLATGVFSTISEAITSMPDTSEYNTEGFYGVITEVPERAKYGGITSTVSFNSTKYDVKDVNTVQSPIDDVFRVGDVVEIRGMSQGINDVEYATITAIAPEEVTFKAGTILNVNGFAEIGAAEGVKLWAIQTGGNEYGYILFDGRLGAGSRLYRVGGTAGGTPQGTSYYTDAQYWLYDPNTRERYITEVLTKETLPAYADTSDAETLTFTAVSSIFGGNVTLRRKVPDLDYICGHNNRLYGVSSHEKTKVYNYDAGKYEDFESRVIYVSALGYPWQFYTFEGVDSDSWQAAVGSDNDFTAICEYSGDVLCFKEDRLYRLYGDYPSNFGYYEYTVQGVKKGSYKSSKVINECLYYHAPMGVCAYSGGVPSLVSFNLGEGEYSRGVAGVSGRRYYISLRTGGKPGTYVYDTAVGTWLREDSADVRDFGETDGALYMLADGKVCRVDGPARETLPWNASRSYAPGDMVTDGESTLRCVKGTKAAQPPEIAPDDRRFSLKLTGYGWGEYTWLTVNGGRVYGPGEYTVKYGDEISVVMERTSSQAARYTSTVTGTGQLWWKDKRTFTAVGDTEVMLKASANMNTSEYSYDFTVTRDTAYPAYMVNYGMQSEWYRTDYIEYAGKRYTMEYFPFETKFPVTAGEKIKLHTGTAGADSAVILDGATVLSGAGPLDYEFAPAGDVNIRASASGVEITTTAVAEYFPGYWKRYTGESAGEDWSGTKDYAAGDIVSYGGGKYQCVKAVEGGTAFAPGDCWAAAEPEKVSWEAEFAPWTEGSVTRYTGIDMERKVWRWLRLRIYAEQGSEIEVSAAGTNGEYRKLFTARRPDWYTLKIPVPPMRGDYLKVRLAGTGHCVLRRLDGICETGSDYYNE
nr:MAG TPA: stabilization protein [Caudoviricetes sp.]